MEMSKFDFKIAMPLEKAEREDGWFITAIAAGPEVDLQHERLAPSALEGIVSQIAQNPVPFLNWHNKNDALAEMGEVTKAWLTPEFHMGVEVQLDQDDFRAQKLWKKLGTVNPRTGKPYEYGLSVGGNGDYKDEYEKSGRVRTYYDVQLDEISLTTKPIYTPSLGTVLRKAIDESLNEGDMSKKTDTPESTETKVEVTEKSVTEEVVETPASDENVSEPETTVVEEKVVEKAASARTKEDARKLKRLVGMHREMSSLIAELVLSADDDDATDTASTSAPVVAQKAEETKPVQDDTVILKSEIAELRAIIDELKDRTPAGERPGVLLKKSDEEELNELLKSMSTSDRLRFALAASHNGK